ncbi:hypothetical protein OEZ86_006467 [Tetradesmus obliquus]|nr:hypothetical protein OEZ86_006467 [Tetradesmus obliquus]
MRRKTPTAAAGVASNASSPRSSSLYSGSSLPGGPALELGSPTRQAGAAGAGGADVSNIGHSSSSGEGDVEYFLVQTPLPELESLRSGRGLRLRGVRLPQGKPWSVPSQVSASHLDLTLTVRPTRGMQRFQLLLGPLRQHGEQQQQQQHHHQARALEAGEALRLRLLLDYSILELFLGTGEVLTTRVYRGAPTARAAEMSMKKAAAHAASEAHAAAAAADSDLASHGSLANLGLVVQQQLSPYPHQHLLLRSGSGHRLLGSAHSSGCLNGVGSPRSSLHGVGSPSSLHAAAAAAAAAPRQGAVAGGGSSGMAGSSHRISVSSEDSESALDAFPGFSPHKPPAHPGFFMPGGPSAAAAAERHAADSSAGIDDDDDDDDGNKGSGAANAVSAAQAAGVGGAGGGSRPVGFGLWGGLRLRHGPNHVDPLVAEYGMYAKVFATGGGCVGRPAAAAAAAAAPVGEAGAAGAGASMSEKHGEVNGAASEGQGRAAEAPAGRAAAAAAAAAGGGKAVSSGYVAGAMRELSLVALGGGGVVLQLEAYEMASMWDSE